MSKNHERNLPVINIPLLQRDACFLLTLLPADEKIAGFDNLPDITEQRFEGL